ncbi:34370_t:CDS:1, partial [Racocetra persica]
MTNDDKSTKEYMTYEPVNVSKSSNKTGKEKRNIMIVDDDIVMDRNYNSKSSNVKTN